MANRNEPRGENNYDRAFAERVRRQIDPEYTDNSAKEEAEYYRRTPLEEAEYEGYEASARRKPTMAARAAGKASTDIYGVERTRDHSRQTPYAGRYAEDVYSYEEYEEDARKIASNMHRKRRKKRHPFRNFLIILVLLAAAGFLLYSILFEKPELYTDGVHTRNPNICNILVCATDEEGLRTDTIMLLSVNTVEHTTVLTSIPRDTIVDDSQTVKLNGIYGVYGGGASGASAMEDELLQILGFRPDGYVIISYDIFRDVVNAMGGVTFDVPMDMEVDGLYVPAGEQLLDGEQALAVCRYRYGYAMADIQRQYVQQTFVKAVIRQLLTPAKILRWPAVYRAAMGQTVTDLSEANLRYLALQVLRNGFSDLQQNTLPGEGVTIYGTSCYGLYGGSVVDMVNTWMNPFEEEITLDDVYILTVSDGYLVVSTERGVAFDASTYQY